MCKKGNRQGNILTFFEEKPLFLGLIGLVLGATIGWLISIPFAQLAEQLPFMFLGALLGVVITGIFDFLNFLCITLQNREPKRLLLGSLVTDTIYIYISTWFRDLTKPQLSLVKTTEGDYIVGSSLVYGKADALSLALIYEFLRSAHKKGSIAVESGDEKWNRSAICIGAHNPKTRVILNSENFKVIKYIISPSCRFIIKREDITRTDEQGFRHRKVIRNNKRPNGTYVDYGLVIKCQDIYHEETKDIIILAGLGDDGTMGAAYFFTKHYKELYKERSFCKIIQTENGYESARLISFDEYSIDYDYREEE